MPAIEPSPDVLCDVHNGDMQKDQNYDHGCRNQATFRTDGSEVDTHMKKVPSIDPDLAALGIGKHVPMNRPSIPNLYVCDHHRNWPHSEDAIAFSKTPRYTKRGA